MGPFSALGEAFDLLSPSLRQNLWKYVDTNSLAIDCVILSLDSFFFNIAHPCEPKTDHQSNRVFLPQSVAGQLHVSNNR